MTLDTMTLDTFGAIPLAAMEAAGLAVEREAAAEHAADAEFFGVDVVLAAMEEGAADSAQAAHVAVVALANATSRPPRFEPE